MGGGASKYGIAMKDHKLVVAERDELASAHKAKEKMLALLHKDHEQLSTSFRDQKAVHLDVVAQCAGLKIELNHERHKREAQDAALDAARARNDACEEELAVLRKRVGAMTHGNGERDIQERRKIIRELEELQGGVEKGPMRSMFELVKANLRREIAEIAARLPPD